MHVSPDSIELAKMFYHSTSVSCPNFGLTTANPLAPALTRVNKRVCNYCVCVYTCVLSKKPTHVWFTPRVSHAWTV